ncbi:MAG: COX15/CtaA family protein [Saprospiraceae bacterium]|jgi:cytochrome c oxidase assembly protein subunit 15|nr:COX15/CtaA family protein [Saprospiraceae bacterium]
MEYSKSVKIWLSIGLVMVFIQVIVGGITRLTESGLSITKWNVVSGTFPPTNDESWVREFNLYKDTPQYKEINEGMSLSDFKFIYFWEYVHRFWARVMGFVFLIPFLYFLKKKMIDPPLLKKLGIVIFLALLAAAFGWIMVASGLVERPWVNAYKLSIHLIIAFSVYAALLWALFSAYKSTTIENDVGILLIRPLILLFILFCVQVFLGGILSGMKAAVIYPTWPDMNGCYLPSILMDIKEWSSENFYNYDRNGFMPALIHFLHRNTAYVVFLTGCWLAYKLYYLGRMGFPLLKRTSVVLIFSLLFQVFIGIITVINSKGSIPILWGVLHQVGALLILSTLVFLFFVIRIKK